MVVSTLSKDKLEFIQVLRGIAAMLVLGYHVAGHSVQFFDQSFAWGIFLHANIGVDLFFVVSGFIIYFANSRHAGSWGEVPFYFWRRFVRIYPILWVTLGLYLVAHLAIANAETFPVDGASIFLTASLLPQAVLDLLHIQNARLVVGVAWTLFYEVVFYAVFGLLLILPRRFFRLSTSLFAVSNICLFLLDSPVVEMFGTIPFVEFSLGIIAAMIVEMRGAIRAYSLRIFIFSLLLFLVVCFSVGTVGDELGDTERLVLVLTCFVLVIGAAGVSKVSSFPGKRLLLLLGNASFSIYLTHYIIVQVFYGGLNSLGYFEKINQVLFNSSLFVICLAAGVAYYCILEKPLLRFFRSKKYSLDLANAGGRLQKKGAAL